MKKTLRSLVLTAASLCLMSIIAKAQTTTTIFAAKDASIFSENAEGSNGAGELFVGRTAQPANRRALIQFNLENIPAEAVIMSASLSMTGSRQSTDQVSVHRLTADWGEGATAGAGNGGGQPSAAQDGDATWSSNFFGSSTWTNDGGDFVDMQSATGGISSGSNTTFTSDGLLTDIQGWISGDTENFGWILIGDEVNENTAVRITSRESTSNAPTLEVTYMVPVVVDRSVAINEIAPDGRVEIINNGEEAVDVSNYWLCNRPGYEVLAVLTVTCGDLVLLPGATVTIQLNNVEINESGDELGLYTAPGFANAANLVDYVIWGDRSGATRESLAVDAGIWTQGERATEFTAEQSLSWDGEGDAAANWTAGTPDLCGGMTACEAVGGTIEITGGSNTISICADDGLSDAFDVSLTGNMGMVSGWVITDPDRSIIATPEGPPFDLEGAGGGNCLIWHISYNEGLEGLSERGSLDQLIGCYNLSNSILVERNVNCGVNRDISINELAEDGRIELINTGESTIDISSYWLCNRPQYEIISSLELVCGDLNLAPGNTVTVRTSAVMISGAGDELGLYRTDDFGSADDISDYVIWGPRDGSTRESVAVAASIWMEGSRAGIFDPNQSLSWDGEGDDASDYTAGEATLCGGAICAVEGGALEGGPFSFCVGDGVADTIGSSSILLTGNQGTNSQWVVTDSNGNILGLPDSFTDVNFDGAGGGNCLVWHLSYEDGLIGAELGLNANDLDGCFSLSNPLTVLRTNPQGGVLTGGPFTFCVGDGLADFISTDAIGLTGNSGANSQWIITDMDGNILGLPDSFTDVDFDGAGLGTCLIWHLSYEEGIVGLVDGANANNLQGCFNLSNSISVDRVNDDVTCGTSCDVVGGLLTGGPFRFCVGDGAADNIPADAIGLFDNVGPNSQWVVTDINGNILGLPPTFSAVDFDGAGLGTCLVWHLSFEDGLTGAEVGLNANDLQGCFSLSNSVAVERVDDPATCGTSCDVVGGLLTGGPFRFCVGDGQADNIPADAIGLFDNVGPNSQWVVTDINGNILGLPPTFSAVDFDGAGLGTCLVWHLSFEDGLSGAEVGLNANDLQGCFSLSNSVAVERVDDPATCGTSCDVIGGLLTGGPFRFCVGDGTADNIPADAIGLVNNSGPNSQWVVTDINGNILGLPPTFSAVDFDGAGLGTCLVWHLSFEDGLSGAEVGLNANDLQGCFSLSNSVAVERVDDPASCGTSSCDVVGGLLTGGPFRFCVGDGQEDNIPADAIGLFNNVGPNSQWVVTDLDGTILGLPPSFDVVNFDGAGAGVCLVWHLSFEDGLSGAEVGLNANSLQGCYSLSNPVAIERSVEGGPCGGNTTCEVAGGLLTGGPFRFCVGDGAADNVSADAIGLFNNSGPNSQWVVTDIDGKILGLPPTFSAVDFDGAGLGTCLIWHLSFEDGLTGAEVGANANDLQGCFSLSNPVAVERVDDPATCGTTSCDVVGGLLTGGPFRFCVGDGQPDNIPADAVGLFNNIGPNSQWVVTDLDGTILGLPPSFDVVNFDGAGTGVCLVWHLSFEDGLVGAEVGLNANELQGCYSLSNPVAVERSVEGGPCGGSTTCDVVGGLLTGGPFRFCVGDGQADKVPADAIGLFNNVGPNSQWVVTDLDGTILGLPPTFSAVDFDGAGEGVCLIWHLSFEDGLKGAEVGANAMDLEGCYSLSNPVAIERSVTGGVCSGGGACDVDGGLLTGGPFMFCVGDGAADMIPSDGIGVFDQLGPNTQWVVTDIVGNILGLPDSFDSVNFDGAGEGVCLVWLLSYDGAIVGAEVGLNANNIVGCYDLSNPVAVERSTDPAVCGDVTPPVVDIDECTAPANLKAIKINSSSYRVSWDRAPYKFKSFEIMMGFENEPNSFVTIPFRRNTLVVSATWSKTIVFKVRTRCTSSDVSEYSETLYLGTSGKSQNANISTGSGKGLTFGAFTVFTEEFSMRPNPASDFIQLSVDGGLENAIVDVYNIQGQRVFTKSFSSRDLSGALDLSALQNGAYILSVTRDGNNIGRQKLVISK